MLSIDNSLEQELKKKYPGFEVNAYCPYRSRQTSRYIQIFIDGCDHDLHYEYIIDSDWEGRVELHFEGNWKEKFGVLIDKLINRTQNYDELTWDYWDCGYRCRHSKKIDTIEELFQTMSYMMDVFDDLIKDLLAESPTSEKQTIPSDKTLPTQDNNVELFEKKYGEIIRLHLSIPNYQRIYCWSEENVKCLLNDILDHISSDNTAPYRLGTIILHSHDNKYDIIDGQQRLVTLSLLLSELGIETSLLEEKFSSQLSVGYIGYNKYLIHEYVNRKNMRRYKKNLQNSIEFSVLVLQNTSIDLAYTFFSNQNSRGIALTDYDLLKAHHLRYIPTTFEQQSKHAVEVWNKMIENGRPENDQPDYVRTLDTYIYRLRKWMRKKDCDDSTNNYRIKREYEAAPIIEDIPPFGERFYFNEPIQGGVHFFSYVEQHLNKYHTFSQTEEYKSIHSILQGGSTQWYRDAIESILFCYFLKFGTYCLSDALVVIMRILLQHRYENSRASKSSIVKYTGNSELVLIINQATSPTFFLGEARQNAKELSYPASQDMRPIMRNVRDKAKKISRQLEQRISIESFKNLNR
jgi:hypothetical protein